DKPIKRRRWLPVAAVAVVALSGGGAYLATRTRLHHAVTASPDAAVMTLALPDAAVPAPMLIAPDAAAIVNSTLRVDTDPEGSDVTIDGTLAGHSPVEVTLAPGPHRIQVSRAGWKLYDGPITIVANQRQATRISLVRARPRPPVEPPPVDPFAGRPDPPDDKKPNPYR
ncbi:MAG TPA: PEGA domain-containing protein, partial [Kofleriaceae bacterium]|nr:PEGA domain-containing protein [Kofleriaceae bacterium]